MNIIKEYYEENGYYIFRKLIPEKLIGKLLERYHAEILPSKAPFFRQSNNRWESNRITAQGYADESFLRYEIWAGS